MDPAPDKDYDGSQAPPSSDVISSPGPSSVVSTRDTSPVYSLQPRLTETASPCSLLGPSISTTSSNFLDITDKLQPDPPVSSSSQQLYTITDKFLPDNLSPLASLPLAPKGLLGNAPLNSSLSPALFVSSSSAFPDKLPLGSLSPPVLSATLPISSTHLLVSPIPSPVSSAPSLDSSSSLDSSIYPLVSSPAHSRGSVHKLPSNTPPFISSSAHPQRLSVQLPSNSAMIPPHSFQAVVAGRVRHQSCSNTETRNAPPSPFPKIPDCSGRVLSMMGSTNCSSSMKRPHTRHDHVDFEDMNLVDANHEHLSPEDMIPPGMSLRGAMPSFIASTTKHSDNMARLPPGSKLNLGRPFGQTVSPPAASVPRGLSANTWQTSTTSLDSLIAPSTSSSIAYGGASCLNLSCKSAHADNQVGLGSDNNSARGVCPLNLLSAGARTTSNIAFDGTNDNSRSRVDFPTNCSGANANTINYDGNGGDTAQGTHSSNVPYTSPITDGFGVNGRSNNSQTTSKYTNPFLPPSAPQFGSNSGGGFFAGTHNSSYVSIANPSSSSKNRAPPPTYPTNDFENPHPTRYKPAKTYTLPPPVSSPTDVKSKKQCLPTSLHGQQHHTHPNHPTTTTNAIKMKPTNGTVIADSDMDDTMGYCYDRGDGQYTRLIPVDSLPFALKDIPARVGSDEGLIVLPVPRKAGNGGQPADSQLLPASAVTPPSSPGGTPSTDLIQSRIDIIVNASPTAGKTSSGPVVLSRNNNLGKREKIYCDKWIHDGTCAFTQQGCKFKHEMPADKETQMSLGLFHGYPLWWKKHCAEQQQMPMDDRPIALPAAYGGSRHGGAAGGGTGPVASLSWRRIQADAPAQGSGTSFGVGGYSGSARGHGRGPRGGFHGSQGRSGFARFNQTNFGPIGPPSRGGLVTGGGLRRNESAAAYSREEGSGGRPGGGVSLNSYDDCEEADARSKFEDVDDDATEGIFTADAEFDAH